MYMVFLVLRGLVCLYTSNSESELEREKILPSFLRLGLSSVRRRLREAPRFRDIYAAFGFLLGL